MINLPTLVITVILAALAWVLPRRLFVIPFIVAASFIPADQRMIIFDLDFTPLRILLVAAMGRLYLLGEVRRVQWGRFDKAVLVWAVMGAIIYVVQWGEMRAVIYKCGVLLDVLGTYWVFRQYLRSWDEISVTFNAFAVCAVLLAVPVMYEFSTGRNPFVVLGRVVTWVREGRYRCQAAFPHSIMMGLFWGTLAPVFLAMTRMPRHRWLFWMATGASVFIVFASASSTPVCTLAAVLLLVALYKYRVYGRSLAWALLLMVMGLHVVMKAPVWHLLARVNVIGGSTGHHRYRLVDACIRHFGEWVFLGTRDTAHWGFGLQDVTNEYVIEAVRGGLATLVAFVVVLIMAVNIAGAGSLRAPSHGRRWLMWGICVSLVGHCISFLGVAYFGQMRMLLYLMLGAVGMMAGVAENKPSLPSRPAGARSAPRRFDAVAQGTPGSEVRKLSQVVAFTHMANGGYPGRIRCHH